MNYRYVALGRDNRIVQGALEAADARAVEEWLGKSQLRPVSVKAGSAFSVTGLRPGRGKVTKKEVVLFSQTLATLLASGTPLLTGIQLLRAEAKSQAFQSVLDGIAGDLKAGSSLYAAMAKKPKVFPRVYVRLIEAGERSGTLETVLRHLATYINREIALTQQVKKALTYPVIVVVVAVVVVGMLVTVVLPTFVDLLTSFKTDLPMTTRLVIGLGNAAQTWKVHGLVALLALGAGSFWYVRRPKGRREFHRALLSAPGIGSVVLHWDLARFSRTMSLLQNAGLPVAESMQLARDSASNQVFQDAASNVRAQVMEGHSLAQAFRAIPFIPGLYVQLVKIGEETGTLEGNLNAIADLYEREVEERITTLTSLLEPAMTVGMGAVVAFIALSMLLPMLKLLSSIQES